MFSSFGLSCYIHFVIVTGFERAIAFSFSCSKRKKVCVCELRWFCTVVLVETEMRRDALAKLQSDVMSIDLFRLYM